jgi:hypothetical protein
MFYLAACAKGQPLPDIDVPARAAAKGVGRSVHRAQPRGVASAVPKKGDASPPTAPPQRRPASAPRPRRRKAAPKFQAEAVLDELDGMPQPDKPKPPAELTETEKRKLGLQRAFTCGLCEQTFGCRAATSVTRKAVQDVRASWGRNTASSPREYAQSGTSAMQDSQAARVAIALLYRPTAVCRFCAQLFGVHYGSSFTGTASPAGLRPAAGSSQAGEVKSDGASAADGDANAPRRISMFPARTRAGSRSPTLRGTASSATFGGVRSKLADLEARLDELSSSDDGYGESEFDVDDGETASAAAAVATRPATASKQRKPSQQHPSAVAAGGLPARVRRSVAAAQQEKSWSSGLPGRISYARFQRLQGLTIPTASAVPQQAASTSGRGPVVPTPRPVPTRDAELGDCPPVVLHAEGRSARAGLRVGDVLVAVAGTSVRNAAQVKARLAKHSDPVVVIAVDRDGSREVLHVMLAGGALDDFEIGDDQAKPALEEEARSAVPLSPAASPEPAALAPARPLLCSAALCIVVTPCSSSLPALPQYVSALIVPQLHAWAAMCANARCVAAGSPQEAVELASNAPASCWVTVFAIGHCAFTGPTDHGLELSSDAAHRTSVRQLIAAIGRGGDGAGLLVLDCGFTTPAVAADPEARCVALLTSGTAAGTFPIGGLTEHLIMTTVRESAGSKALLPALYTLLQKAAPRVIRAGHKGDSQHKLRAPAALTAHCQREFAGRVGFVGDAAQRSEGSVAALRGVDHITTATVFTDAVQDPEQPAAFIAVLDALPCQAHSRVWSRFSEWVAERGFGEAHVVTTAEGPALVVPNLTPSAQQTAQSITMEFKDGTLRAICGIRVRSVGFASSVTVTTGTPIAAAIFRAIALIAPGQTKPTTVLDVA